MINMPPALTVEQARALGYDSWSIHLTHTPCNRGHNGYCATCDPYSMALVVTPSDTPVYHPHTTADQTLEPN